MPESLRDRIDGIVRRQQQSAVATIDGSRISVYADRSQIADLTGLSRLVGEPIREKAYYVVDIELNTRSFPPSLYVRLGTAPPNPLDLARERCLGRLRSAKK